MKNSKNAEADGKKIKYKPPKNEKWIRLLFAVPVIAVLVYILIQFLGK